MDNGFFGIPQWLLSIIAIAGVLWYAFGRGHGKKRRGESIDELRIKDRELGLRLSIENKRKQLEKYKEGKREDK